MQEERRRQMWARATNWKHTTRGPRCQGESYELFQLATDSKPRGREEGERKQS